MRIVLTFLVEPDGKVRRHIDVASRGAFENRAGMVLENGAPTAELMAGAELLVHATSWADAVVEDFNNGAEEPQTAPDGGERIEDE